MGTDSLWPGEEMYEWEGEEEVMAAGYDRVEALVSVEVEDDGDEQRVNGVGEYGFGFWSRWLRTYPRSLFVKNNLH